MPDKIKLYCPQCGTAAEAQREKFADAVTCPGCKQTVQFGDYPREAIPSPPKPKKKPTATWADRLLQVVTGAGIALVVITLFGLLNGNVKTSTWGAIAAVVAAGAALAQVLRLKRDFLHATEARIRAERALVLSNAQITAAANVNNGYRKNFEKLVADEVARLNQENAQIAQKIDTAKREVEDRVRSANDQEVRLKRLGNRLLEDRFEKVMDEVSATNLEGSRQRLKEVIEFCRRNDCHVLNRREEELNRELTHRYNEELRRKRNNLERHLVGKQIREEKLLQEEFEAQISRIESEKSAIHEKLASANETGLQKETILEQLQKKLAELEAEASHASNVWHERKSGHIYVASNIGSFGEGIFMIGMTRRSDPHGVVYDLAKEATPFPFEIHMLVSSDNALELLGKLQQALQAHRLNRVDLAKDFFRVDRDEIWRVVAANHGVIDYESLPSPAEYQQSESMTDAEYTALTKAVQG